MFLIYFHILIVFPGNTPENPGPSSRGSASRLPCATRRRGPCCPRTGPSFHLRVALRRLRHGGRQCFAHPAASAAVHLVVALVEPPVPYPDSTAHHRAQPGAEAYRPRRCSHRRHPHRCLQRQRPDHPQWAGGRCRFPSVDSGTWDSRRSRSSCPQVCFTANAGWNDERVSDS